MNFYDIVYVLFVWYKIGKQEHRNLMIHFLNYWQVFSTYVKYIKYLMKYMEIDRRELKFEIELEYYMRVFTKTNKST